MIAANSGSGIIGSPAPSDSQIEGLADDLDDTVGPNRPGRADLGVQSVDVGWPDSVNFHRAEPRQDDLLPHAPIIRSRASSLSRQMLGLISAEKIPHCRSCPSRLRSAPLSLLLIQRVDPGIDHAAQ